MRSVWPWLHLGHRPISAVLLSGVTAVVVVLAVTATGNPVTHVSANDGGVWLVNDSPGNGFTATFGEFNVPISELGAHFAAPGRSFSANLDVLQEGTVVLGVDQTQHTVYPIDEQTGAVEGSKGVTYGAQGIVALGGRVAAILEPATGARPGRIWAASTGEGLVASLAGLDVSGKPTTTMDGADALAVDTNGDVFVASRTAVEELPWSGSTFGRPRTIRLTSSLSSVALTTVGTTPVLLDPSRRAILLPSASVTVTLPPGKTAPVLQQPGPGSPSVLVSTGSQLLSVPVAGGTPSVLAAVPNGGGAPANPVELDGCAYGAWAGSPGHVARVCSSRRGKLPLVAAALSAPGGGVSAVTHPVLRVNNNFIVLNDVANGSAWQVAGAPSQALTNEAWLRVLEGDRSAKSNATQNAGTTAAQQESTPILHNPNLYARIGQQSILHVLDDDTDPAGGLLTITSVSPASGPGFSLAVSPDAQTVILTLFPGAPPSVTFSYTVADAGGRTASGPVTVYATTSETPPYQLPNSVRTLHVSSGASVSFQVLGSWRDKQSDPLYLSDASVTGGQVTWTSDGLVSFTAPSVVTDTTVTLTYHVTDGRSPPVPATQQLTIVGSGDPNPYPPIGVPDAAKVVVGQATVLSPLANDIFGADPADPSATLALAGPVSSVTGLAVATNTNTGQLTVTASAPGVYALSYQATYGSASSAPTQILVQAVSPVTTPQSPVTTPISVLLHGQLPTTVDVLASDYDPSGGLLTVISVSAPPGLQATIEQGQYVRMVSAGGGTTQNLTVTYQVSDGKSNPSTGQIAVAEEPPLPPTPPVVPDTYATVRAGDEVNVPVLASATDPDGEPISLLTGGRNGPVQLAETNPQSTPYRTGLGAASISGGYLCYSAPSGTGMTAPETVTASYIVEAADGSATTGHTYLMILPDAASENTAPQPTEVDARVSAGGTVSIPIPTTGVDPDGDSVTVTGIATPPSLGRVIDVKPTSITYQAFPLSSTSGQFSGGTDTFAYEVTAPTGQTAEADVRVGVTPPVQPQSPVAVDHFTTGSPGSTVTVPLLSGDVVSSGSPVVVVPLSKYNASLPAGTKLVGAAHDILQAKVPRDATPLVIAYGITDGTGAPSVAHVVIRPEPRFVEAPVAVDYFPSLPSPSARSIVVDVLAKDSNPSGGPQHLKLEGSPAHGVTVEGGKNLVIPVTTYPRVVPYVVKSLTTGVTATGVVYVPGSGSGMHLLSGKTIQVPAGGSTSVSITNYIADPGHTLRLTSTGAVSAAPGFGLTEDVTGSTQVRLTAGAGYAGPGSLTVQVTAATAASKAGASTQTFSIPVQVGHAVAIVRCPSTPLTVVQGGAPLAPAVVSLCSVWTPNGSDPTSMMFTAVWSRRAAGVSLGWAPGETGKVLELAASSSATPGTTGQVAIGVSGGALENSSTLNVQVAAAPLPTVTPVTIPGVEAGHSVTVDMTQYVASPLAQPQIAVLGVSGPNQGSATVSHSGSSVTITPLVGSHGTMTFSVQVGDAGPSRSDRAVTDTITLQVLDVPSAPTGLQGVPGNDQVALSWQASIPNGSPVSSYTVTMNGGATRQTAGTAIVWAGLTNGTSYTFSVTAVNQVGVSPPSSSVTVAPQSVPGVPGNVTATGGDQQATVSWSAAAANGQAVTSYEVSISPAVGGPSVTTVPGTTTTFTWKGLANSIGPYSFTVAARNSVGLGPSSPPSNKVYAHGAPQAPAPPTASGAVSPDQTTTTITVTWPAVPQCNDAQPCASYVVQELRNGTTAATVKVPGGCGGTGANCSVSFGPLTNDGSAYSFELQAVNEEGQSSPFSGPSNVIHADGYPGAVTDLSATPGTHSITVTFTLPPSNGASLSRVKYTAAGKTGTVTGTWPSPGSPGQQYSNTIAGLNNGTTYVVSVVVYNERTSPSPTSNQASAIPYGPPQPPAVTAVANGTSITFSWSGGGNNGRPVASYTYCIDGACTTTPGAGSTTVTYACNQTHSIYATVTDTAGQTSAPSATASATTAACAASQSISIAWGPYAAPYGKWLTITWTGFPVGSISWTCVEGGVSYGPYYTTATSSPYTVSTTTCYDATPGQQVYVVTNGVRSNVIPSD